MSARCSPASYASPAVLRAQSLPRSRSTATPLPASPARRLHARGPRPVAASGGVQREVLTRQQRTKLDSGSDREFYAFPRFVKHVDDGFLAQLTQLYRQRLAPGSAILELGASHISHLPDDVAFSVRPCVPRPAASASLRARRGSNGR